MVSQFDLSISADTSQADLQAKLIYVREYDATSNGVGWSVDASGTIGANGNWKLTGAGLVPPTSWATITDGSTPTTRSRVADDILRAARFH
ncbi:MAG TPA: hypothetical protein VGI81_24560 [Tepidisphaeraceae bacterium]|jgi:hypothetical protein